MHERPQGALFSALRELGYRVEPEAGKDRLPVRIRGDGPSKGRACSVRIEESSQFASALLLCAAAGGWSVRVTGESAEESPYVAMTAEMIKAFPDRGGSYGVEPDASSGSYFQGAQWLLSRGGGAVGSRISVRRWPGPELQVDALFSRVWPEPDPETWPKGGLRISRIRSIGDSIMTAIVLAPFAPAAGAAAQPVLFEDLGRLRVQECERVAALRTELTRCGATVVEEGDTLAVFPSALHGAEIRTYDDHRMAMCFAILGLKVPGIRIQNPGCVKKTFPNFFEKLGGTGPGALGARILDAKSGRALAGDELFAG
jgi:3-phosphoshikimate 1-carboxyvinyltransferase